MSCDAARPAERTTRWRTAIALVAASAVFAALVAPRSMVLCVEPGGQARLEDPVERARCHATQEPSPVGAGAASFLANPPCTDVPVVLGTSEPPSTRVEQSPPSSPPFLLAVALPRLGLAVHRPRGGQAPVTSPELERLRSIVLLA